MRNVRSEEASRKPRMARGKVTKVDENEVELELGPQVKVRAIKATLAEIRPLGGGKPAND